MGQGSAVSCPSGVRGKAQAANAFWCILSLKIVPGSHSFFFYKRPKKKKQLYRQEVPGVPTFKKVAERRSSAFQLKFKH